jgi:hypothetical protein
MDLSIPFLKFFYFFYCDNAQSFYLFICLFVHNKQKRTGMSGRQGSGLRALVQYAQPGVGFGTGLLCKTPKGGAWKQSSTNPIFQSDCHLLSLPQFFFFSQKFDFSPKFVYNKIKEKQERAPTT